MTYRGSKNIGQSRLDDVRGVDEPTDGGEIFKRLAREFSLLDESVFGGHVDRDGVAHEKVGT